LRLIINLVSCCNVPEAAAEVIGRLGGVQDVLASMRAFPDNAEIASNCCGALWSLAVNGMYCRRIPLIIFTYMMIFKPVDIMVYT